MKNIKKYIFVICLLLLAGSGYAQQGNIKIIANDNVDITSVNKDQLSRLFLKKTTKWDNGVKVTPVDLVTDSDVRQNFTQNIHKKSISAINAYWQKKIFTGKGVPPVELQSDKEVIEFVSSTPGAIGYVSASASLQGVKTISIK